jgi:hypothetical protein
LPVAKAAFTFVVIFVSVKAVAVPVYAFFTAPSVFSPTRCIEVLAGAGALALVSWAKAGIASPILRAIAGTRVSIRYLPFITLPPN